MWTPLGIPGRFIPAVVPQVNTPAAEVLYTIIEDWAQLDKESTVLDVCCGTGTISLSLAQVSLRLCLLGPQRASHPGPTVAAQLALGVVGPLRRHGLGCGSKGRGGLHDVPCGRVKGNF